MSWEQAWREGRTGWDAGEAAPALLELLEDPPSDLPTAGHALVPGTGSGYDLLALARAGFRGRGVDLALTAAARFRGLRQQEGISEEQASVLVGDFFEELDLPAIDLIWDYTFLCALQPEQREDWARRCAELLAPQGQLVTLIFPIPPGQEQAIPAAIEGPPFAMSPALLRSLLMPAGFEPLELRPVLRSHPGRQGKEWLGRWRLTAR